MLPSAMRAAIDANAAFLTQVTAGKLFGEQVDDSADASAAGGAANRSSSTDETSGDTCIRSSTFDMAKVRSTLRQFAREWSVQGEAEREQSFGRLLR
jgi:hypothetical protein